MANEIMKAENFQLVTMEENMDPSMREEFEDLGSIDFDRIKIPAGGGTRFEVPTEDPDRPDSVTELVGVILDHHSINAYWPEAFSGKHTPPYCSSFDGVTGMVLETGEVIQCESCPHNRFRQGEDGNTKKECKNKYRVYLLMSGKPLPVLLMLPTMSVKPMKNYALRMVMDGFHYWQFYTRISLKKAVNSTGISYSQAAFSRCGELSAEQAARVAPIAAKTRAERKKNPIQVEDMSDSYSRVKTEDKCEAQGADEGEDADLNIEFTEV